MHTKNVFTQKDPIAEAIAKIAEADYKAKMEELKGQQHKIDKNKNNKIDAQDFAILRGEKKAVKEEEEQVEEGWDDMMKAVKARSGPQPSGGSGVKQGSRYGGSKQKEKPEQDDDKKKVKEEFEQIDELNKDTLKSYRGKAILNRDKSNTKIKRAAQSAYQGDDNDQEYAKSVYDKETKNIEKRTAGLKRASSKLNKEEFEQIDESDKLFKSIAEAAAVRYGSVESGEIVADAVLAKLRKEETDYEPLLVDRIVEDIIAAIEQLDENNKNAVKSYIFEKVIKDAQKEKKDDVPFDGPYSKKKSATPGKFGQGYSTARHLARQGMKSAMKEDIEEIEERVLTSGETAEKERIVKGMKKSLAGFKSRYGDKAKSVMYATATKAAKKD